MWLCRLSGTGSSALPPFHPKPQTLRHQETSKLSFMLPPHLVRPIFTSTDYLAIKRLSHRRFNTAHGTLQGKRTNHTFTRPSRWGKRTVTPGQAQKRWMLTDISPHKHQHHPRTVLPGTTSLSGGQNSTFLNICLT